MAIRVSDGRGMTYGQLEESSNRIAGYIDQVVSRRRLDAKVPIVVYGHKDPLMVACFLGCLKSGHPYVPIDMYSVPRERACGIVDQIGSTIVFEVEQLDDSLNNYFESRISHGGGAHQGMCSSVETNSSAL